MRKHSNCVCVCVYIIWYVYIYSYVSLESVFNRMGCAILQAKLMQPIDCLFACFGNVMSQAIHSQHFIYMQNVPPNRTLMSTFDSATSFKCHDTFHPTNKRHAFKCRICTKYTHITRRYLRIHETHQPILTRIRDTMPILFFKKKIKKIFMEDNNNNNNQNWEHINENYAFIF